MSLDRAIEAAATAWANHYTDLDLDPQNPYDLEAIRIAVEAAAPHITEEYNKRTGWDDAEHWKKRAERAEAEVEEDDKIRRILHRRAERAEAWVRELENRVIQNGERAERAEAEVERLERHIGNIDKRGALKERALADQLAEALRFYQHTPVNGCDHCKALAAWEEARRGQ